MYNTQPRQSEMAIFKNLLKRLNDAGIDYSVTYERGYTESGATSESSMDEQIEAAIAVDEVWIMTGKPVFEPYDYFIQFVWGEGDDVIIDYSQALDDVVSPCIPTN